MTDPGADPAPQTVRIGERTYHLVKRRDGAGMQLVHAIPDDLPAQEDAESRRLQAAAAHGDYRASPRAQPPANVTTPVDVRTATILSHEAPAEVRDTLNGQPPPQGNRGRR
jgi:hypothetical protein